ncbi:hypothetical protein BASA50_009634 [Batrachochytrium salamandrivorans]|uniref:RING-type domain-containing protein n=1 Tax=Batrachochytrium salamandrivorans TaxID=1357716 RepID=A0ABQ8F3F2_9FUNG|nr:hypothetical protein BASA60_006520 [Batrachochytrium salamandrivorans]KAH6581887.1 hypothetical protein BASA61_008775 [Batrachochytrium salamandrivorans]KAH6589931.1 hypothetical protein BASA50_009634 [Batrachochytrium salamandrivorans]
MLPFISQLQPSNHPPQQPFMRQPTQRQHAVSSSNIAQPNTNSSMDIGLQENFTPPEITIEQSLKGGYALRKLKQYCDRMYETNQLYVRDYSQARKQISKLNTENGNLIAELQEKKDMIAKSRQHDIADQRHTRSLKEVEILLLEETRRRIDTDKVFHSIKAELEQCKIQLQIYTDAAKNEEIQRQVHEQTITDQNIVIEDYAQKTMQVKLNYLINELKVESIKYKRKTNELEMDLASSNQKNGYLSQVDSSITEENTHLQRKLRELISANKEVTANYQIVKKNNDLKRHEFEELTLELEEAKRACQFSLRSKKNIQDELISSQKIRAEILERSKNLESALFHKEKDNADLLRKVNETISDYELKLEHKEDQICEINLQLNKEIQKNHIVQQLVTSKEKQHELVVGIDSKNDAEKLSLVREKSLLDEINRLAEEMHIRDEKLMALEEQVKDLTSKQLNPRIERLKTIELDIKNRMEEYALSGERMETGLLCPRDLKVFVTPMTLSPCGHTFCRSCLEAIQAENYNVIKCEVCGVVATSVYRNQQIEMVEEQFSRFKHLTLSFLEWIKPLRVDLSIDETNQRNNSA